MILIITTYPNIYTKLKEYILHNGIKEYVLITSKKNELSYKGLNCDCVNEFNQESIVSRAIFYHQKNKVKKVISFGEKDVIIAAYIRSLLNIEGQKINNAEVFRNKYIMKKKLLEKKFIISNFEGNLTREKILFFIKKNGKSVLKPLYGVASKGIFIIDAETNLENIVCKINLDNYILEKYVDFKAMYSIDSLVINGVPVINAAHKYNIDPLMMTNTNKWHVVNQLNIDSTFSKRLIEIQKSLIDKLENENSSYAMHTEVFHTIDDRIMICEVASRFGGARIPDLLNNAFKVNVYDMYLDSLFEQRITQDKVVEQKSKVCSILIPKVIGEVNGFPDKETLNLPFISEYSLYVKNGDYIKEMKHSVDSAAVMVLTVPLEEEITVHINNIKRYFPY
ncbi:hypothetical protein EVU91_13220 [Macrococcoides bohemicum]|uniref:ATP-grasp domain-containing protein n=1 Tax=Macrococcoides bohemicum TaxID=1903056 RepID=UPI00105A8484|nr:hypothetical protein [Macrococcus bohemicus]TDL33469.1 hypothetical protein EVU91_13220 [Macrococcus bohemicus]